MIGVRRRGVETRAPMLVNRDVEASPSSASRSLSWRAGEVGPVRPAHLGWRASGVVSLQNLDHTDAFTDADCGC